MSRYKAEEEETLRNSSLQSLISPRTIPNQNKTGI
jgi:hypothetical protein